MNVYKNKKHRCAVHVDVSNQPAIINISHYPLNGVEGMIYMRGIMHGKDNSGYDHYNEHKSQKRAKIPPIIKIFWCRVSRTKRMVHETENRKAIFNPVYYRVLKFLFHFRLSIQF